MAKSHKTCMEQAEIIDTFGTYQMPPCIPSPSTIISSSLVALYFYHFMRYVLFLERLALRFCFQFSLALFAVVTIYIPAYLLFFVGEIHAPLELELLIGFACLFF